jgi:hypothetical protein
LSDGNAVPPPSMSLAKTAMLVPRAGWRYL